jgi:hypothetical protein
MDTTDFRRMIGGVLSNIGSTNVLKMFGKNPHIHKVNDSNTEESVVASAAGFSGGRINKLKKYIR